MLSSVPRHSGRETIPSIFTWSIANFSTITEDTYSDILVISGYQWRLNIFLTEFISDGIPTLQIDLLVELSSTLPHGWSRDAKFDLSVIDQVSGQYTRQEEKKHKFKTGNYDGGFSLFIPSSDLYDHRREFIMNDTLIINAGVHVTKLPVVDTFILKPRAGAQDYSVFTWSIKNFSRVYEHYTKVFVVGDYEWQAMLDVFDHKTTELPPNLTIRLQVANSAQLFHAWNIYTEFNFSVVDQVSGRHTMRGGGQHKFDSRTLRVDGLVVPLCDLWDPRKGFLVDDTLIVEVGVLAYSNRIRLPQENHLPKQPRPGPKAPLNDTLILNRVSAAQEDITCTWTIKNFSRVTTKQHSQVFVVGGYEWRATIYLDDRGKPGFLPANLTIFLGVANSAQLSYGWSRDTKFSFSVVDQVSSRYTLRKEGMHKFEAKGLRVGLVTVSLSDLWNPSKGFLVDDTLIIEVEIDPDKTRPTPRNNRPSKRPNKPNSIKPMTKCNLSNILEPIEGHSTSAAHLTASPSSCVICMDAPSEGACVPCGHMAGCMPCLKEIKAKNMGCPVCRAKIQLIVQIYTI